ncbi:hypothetical protein [Pedobacter miscanthi]|uniref:Uncharacterized protein n=1 Tax=Pedobacter miscanthi TaxID=2259170 RepID=A0A366KUQ8_9SPHI|nr:hypothetical protein [Pedobacter miscanthi]RBQ05367.1 hypothetical protein DRW42_16945 [Pedobacter miscanthi]
MKKILFAVLLISIASLTHAQDQTLDKKYRPVVTAFISVVKSGNIEKLSSKIAYPLKRAYPIPAIKNKQEFIKRYKEIFDDNLTKKIVNSKPDTDWDAVGWRGIMFLNGELWLDTNGKLIAVNHQSRLEAKEQARLINAEKTSLHPSLSNFIQPVLVFETAQFRIRIDDLGNNNYRYAAWPLKSKMSDKPKLVLNNGKWTPDGSGGNHNYQFKSGDYLYTCFITVMGEKDSPPALLVISKAGTEILSQPAKKITF